MKFLPEKLKNDTYFNTLASYMLEPDQRKCGRFTDIHTVEEFINKLSNANLEQVKYLPKNNLYIYKTHDLGLGRSSYLSPNKLNELIQLNKVPKDIPIDLEYEHGNIFIKIDIKDIDDTLLLTDEVYLIVNKDTNEIWNIIIGKLTNPNFHYYSFGLNGKRTTLEKLKVLEHFNRINIREPLQCNFI